MTFDERFPLKLYLNLNKHDQRRRQVENELLDAGIEDFERVPAFAGKWFRQWRGYPTGNRYAQALTHKSAVWTGWRRKAPAVLVFEDDVVLTPGFKELAEKLALPEDWAFFSSVASTGNGRRSWRRAWCAARWCGTCMPMAEGDVDGVFLATDNADSAAQWADWLAEDSFPHWRVERVWRAGKMRQTSLEEAAVDLFLLARCDSILASVWSSLSWMASEIGEAAYEVAPAPGER